jgi:hypothetical protein
LTTSQRKHASKAGYHHVEAKQQRGSFNAGASACTYHGNPACIEAAERAILPHKEPVFADPGNSGALVYDAAGNPLGLLWGGMTRPRPSTATDEDDSGLRLTIHAAKNVNIERHLLPYTHRRFIDSILADLTWTLGKDSFKLFWSNTSKQLRRGSDTV